MTQNHDMMQICADAGQRFVRVDPRGRQLTKARQLLTVLHQIDRWIDILRRDEGTCVQAMRTSCRPIAPAEAARLATQRQRANERKIRKRKQATDDDQLQTEEQA